MSSKWFYKIAALLLVLCLLISSGIVTALAEEGDFAEEQSPVIAEEPVPSEEPASSEEPEDDVCTVTFFSVDGETVLLSTDIKNGELISDAPEADGDMKICAWLNEAGEPVDLAEHPVSCDCRFTAAAEMKLNTAEHIVYINGYENGAFRPQNSITRAQAAKMLYSLLVLTGKGVNTCSFSDVPESYWAYEPISCLASLGIINGYNNGTFRPNNKITRAEFSVIISRFFNVPEGTVKFNDVPSDAWYMNNLAFACDKGWITGYKSGNFGPSDPLTRAQAVTIINRVTGRNCDKNMLAESYAHSTPFADVSPDFWAFGSIIEAAVSHSYTRDGDIEIWSDYSTATTRAEGLCTVDGSLGYVDEQGLFRVFEKGFLSLNDKLYYVPETGAAIAKYAKGPVIIGSDLYYSNDDGSLAVSTTIGKLYFGSDGKYTSGNETIDKNVKELLAKCTDSSMSRETMLRNAYLYLRDSGKFGYVGGEHYGRGTTNWYEATAIEFFTPYTLTKCGGNCYCWASAFMYIARQLGYDAYAVSGGVPPRNSDHAWVMIPWSDGKEYIFDIEMEWGHLHGYYKGQYHYNLYKILPQNAPFYYTFPKK